MVRKVNLLILLGLVIVLVLSFSLAASAQTKGSAESAVAIGKAQLGDPFEYGADGPDSFSCTGLMRYILRENGNDPDAPWVAEEYLNRYTRVSAADMKPGDIVIFSGDWATMYVGDDMLLNANEVDGQVVLTPRGSAGEPLGVARPNYDGQEANTPAAANNNSEEANTPQGTNNTQGADDTDGGNDTGMNLNIFQYLMRLLQSLGF
jgi:NlpC/P60 family